MTKNEMINQGYKYIATQNCELKLELWAKFTGYEDMIAYIIYDQQEDRAIEQTEKCISYTELDMMAQLKDAMKEDLVRNNIRCNVNCMWSSNT